MATSYPSGLDNFSNPTATTAKNAPGFEHHAQHANANDAIEALQAKVGVDGSAVTTSLDYQLKSGHNHDGTNSQKITSVTVPDTRNDNDAVNYLSRSVRWDFKGNSTVGLPAVGNYSGVMGVAPWTDDSGGGNHQLAFQEGGAMYHRYGTRAAGWQMWEKVPKGLRLLNAAPGRAGDTTQSNYAVSSTTSQKVDTTNLRVSFTAPRSGSVLFTFSATLHSGSMYTNLAVGLAANGAGGHDPKSTVWATYTGYSSDYYRVHYQYLMTGLTANTTYSYDMYWWNNSGTSYMYYGGGSSSTPYGFIQFNVWAVD